MGAIFISYRREDTEGHAGRLFEDMRAAFGADSVFMDVAGIEPGRDFRKVIDSKVADCAVLLSVIGRHWLSVKSGSGERRIDDPADFVRLETTAALRRDISVIPVLVHGAKMPTQEDLPAELKELAFRNAVELTHARWDSDVQVLIEALRKQMPQAAVAPAPAPAAVPVIAAAAAPASGKADQPAPAARSRSPLLIGAVLMALLAGGGYYGYRAHAEQESERLAAIKALPAFGTNGAKVKSVTYGEEGGKTMGHFKQTTAGRWVQTDPSGKESNKFSESSRDDWSVYLSDESRNMELQLDLHRRKVSVTKGTDAQQFSYPIVMAQ